MNGFDNWLVNLEKKRRKSFDEESNKRLLIKDARQFAIDLLLEAEATSFVRENSSD